MRSPLAWKRTAAISVVLAVCAWMIEAVLDSFVFHLGPLHERLFPLNEPGEIWMRVEATGTFLILSVYCHVIIAQRKRVEAERAQALLPTLLAAIGAQRVRRSSVRSGPYGGDSDRHDPAGSAVRWTRPQAPDGFEAS